MRLKKRITLFLQPLEDIESSVFNANLERHVLTAKSTLSSN